MGFFSLRDNCTVNSAFYHQTGLSPNRGGNDQSLAAKIWIMTSSTAERSVLQNTIVPEGGTNVLALKHPGCEYLN